MNTHPALSVRFEWAGYLVPRDVLLPVHNIVACTEHCVQRTLPVRTVFFWDIIIRWTRGGGVHRYQDATRHINGSIAQIMCGAMRSATQFIVHHCPGQLICACVFPSCLQKVLVGCRGWVGLGWVGLGWVKASPGRLPRVRAAFPAGPDWAAVPECPVTRPTGPLTAPRPRGGARGREMPPCLCVCALVCLRRGGGLWHTCLLHCCSALAHMARGSVCLVLQAPAGRLESLTVSPPREMWAWARNLHVTRTSYPTTPRLPVGTGRRCYVARLGSDPHSLTAFGTGGAATRAGSGSPRPRAYPGQMEGHQGTQSASLPWVPPVLAALAAALQPA